MNMGEMEKENIDVKSNIHTFIIYKYINYNIHLLIIYI
jgi:hypothetical protein